MKRTVFLMVSAMAILCCGCSTGSGYGSLRTAPPGNALMNTNTLPTLKGSNDRGVCMPISSNSSLSIDVECILDYVQGDGAFDAADEQNDLLYPWIRLNYSF